MRYNLKHIYENLEDIQCKLISFSIDNVKWSCIFSGMGIISPLTQKEVDQILRLGEAEESAKYLISNYVPIKCVYDKGYSSFTDPPPEILNPGSFMWDFSSFKKNISIEAQAFALLALCKSAELLYEHNKIEGYIMLKTARMFYDFMSTYLRNADGLFISGQDKTKNFDKKLKIKIESEEVNLYYQLLVFEATLHLNYVTSNKEMKEYYIQKSQNYFSEALSLFKYLYQNDELFIDLPTKELAESISSLCRCFSIAEDEELKHALQLLITNLSAELCSRIKITGEVERGFEDTSNASLITHFRTKSALLESYNATGLDSFFDTAALINNSLQDLYDTSVGLFLTGNHKSINYSIGDISEVIKHFILNRFILEDPLAFSGLQEFYYYSIEKTAIIQSIVKNTININNQDYFLNENIPLMEEINKAPIFLKNFKLKYKKKNIEFETSKYYCSVNGFYASYIFLHYLTKPFDLDKKATREESEVSPESTRNSEVIAEEDIKLDSLPSEDSETDNTTTADTINN